MGTYVWTLQSPCTILCLSSKGNAPFLGVWLTSTMTRVHICSIPVVHILREQFKPFFISSWLLSVDVQILCLTRDSGLRIISRLRFSFDGAKISEKSAPTSEKVVDCPALLRLPLSWSQQTQFRKEEPLQTWPSAALGRKQVEVLKWERKGRGLTGVSGSDLCQIIIIYYDYTDPITAVQFFLPTVRCLYSYFDTFR